MARYPRTELATLATLATLEHTGIIELHGDGEVSKLLPVLLERHGVEAVTGVARARDAN